MNIFKLHFKLKYLVIPIICFVIIFISIKANKEYFTKDIKVVNNIVVGKKLNSKNKPMKNVSHLNRVTKLHRLKEITFFLNGQPIFLDEELWEKAQRYYLPLNYITDTLGGSYIEDKNEIKICYNDVKYAIDRVNSEVKVESEDSFPLRGSVVLRNGKTYLSLSDIEHIFSLDDHWDYNNKKVFLCKSKIVVKKPKANFLSTAALIRLEDVAAGDIMTKSENLEKMKVFADYLYSEDVKYNVAWIPRYKDPEKNIDNNLLEIESMQNAQFINMLDHMIFRGGVIGLHGYTHQHDNEKSITNVELSEKYNNDVQSTTKIVEAALETANKLNIPVGFFETPHYAATQLQQSVIEQYFNYVYEPYIGLWNKMPEVSLRNKSTIYVPAPLSYVKGDDVQTMINSIKNKESGTLTSFFYHPSKELKFINFYTEDDGNINYTYSEESHMHKLVNTLKENGYTTININQIK